MECIDNCQKFEILPLLLTLKYKIKSTVLGLVWRKEVNVYVFMFR